MSELAVNLKDLDRKYTKQEFRQAMLDVEDKLSQLPDSKIGHEADDFISPLKHSFVDGAYIREILLRKGALHTSKIHKLKHAYFILKGEVSVATEDGVKRIKAPYSGITPAGTKRLIYVHEDTVWVTVHVTKETDLDKIEQEVIAPSFEELDKYLEGRDETVFIGLL